MAETQVFPQDPSTEPIVYRRLSGVAVTGFILAIVFMIVLVIQTILAFRSHTPLMMPGWLEAIPFVAIILCLLAFYFIRNSEGTLAGGKLAAWGFWLGLVFGLSYLAYSTASFFALRQQSEAFALAWIDKIKQNKLNSAFLDTQPPNVRARINPDDDKEMELRFNAPQGTPAPGPNQSRKGMLDQFKDRDYIRILQLVSDDMTVRPAGVRQWEYKEGGYTVRERFEIRTREANYSLAVSTHGSTSPSGEFKGRQWNIVFGETAFQDAESESTELGKLLQTRHRQSKGFVEGWVDHIQRGELEEAYLEALPIGERSKQRLNFLAHYNASAMTAAATNAGGSASTLLQLLPSVMPEPARNLYLSGYSRLCHHGGLIRGPKIFKEGADPWNPEAMLKLMFRPAAPGGPQFRGIRLQLGSRRRSWREEEGRLILTHDAQVGFALPQASGMMLFVDVMVTTESSGAALDPKTDVSWRLVSLELQPMQGVSQGSPVGGPVIEELRR